MRATLCAYLKVLKVSLCVCLLTLSPTTSFIPSSPSPFFSSPRTSLRCTPPGPALIELQVLLQLSDLAGSGGAAKSLIQGSEVLVNGIVETRRSKKLVLGDKVTVNGQNVDVNEIVKQKNYTMPTIKPKTVKSSVPDTPVAINDKPIKTYGGEYRTQEWRDERKAKKIAKRPSSLRRYRFDYNISPDVPTPSEEDLLPIVTLIEKRAILRQGKDFKASDELREELRKKNVEVNDETATWWLTKPL
jgi:ribosome-associated protein